MVQMASDEVVGMITMRDSFMSAAVSVFVVRFVVLASVPVGAISGILRVHSDHMFVHMVTMHIVHVPIVQKAFMPIVH
jgi:hypothetical protein